MNAPAKSSAIFGWLNPALNGHQDFYSNPVSTGGSRRRRFDEAAHVPLAVGAETEAAPGVTRLCGAETKADAERDAWTEPQLSS